MNCRVCKNPMRLVGTKGQLEHWRCDRCNMNLYAATLEAGQMEIRLSSAGD